MNIQYILGLGGASATANGKSVIAPPPTQINKMKYAAGSGAGALRVVRPQTFLENADYHPQDLIFQRIEN